MIAGYYTALERTLFFDHCSDAHRELWDINVQGASPRARAASSRARAAATSPSELNEIYRGAGLLQYRTFGYGHSFGVLCHYYGREAGLELREDIETVLAARHGGLDGADDHAARGPARRRRLSRARHPRGHAEGAENITEFPFGPEKNIVKK